MNCRKKLASVLFLCAISLFMTGCKDEDKNSGEGGGNDQPVAFVIPKAEDVVMYEANPRVFAETNSLKAIEARLDDIKSLGVNALWIMPIYTHGVEKYKGSPYCIKNYTAIDPEYGTMDDLKSLVSSAHNKGMAVLMDWVANHTSWDNVWIEEHKDWYTQDSEGNILPPIAAWSDVADLNYDNAEMRQAMIDAMKFWITEAGVDGFRCDAADYVPIDFWQDAVSQLRTVKNDILMLAEGNKADYFSAGFNMDFGWTFYGYLNSVYNEKSKSGNNYPACQLASSMNSRLAALTADHRTLFFTTNHDKSADEKTDVLLFNGNRGAMSAFVIVTTFAGSPLIYSSQETGHKDKFSFFTYYNLNWDENPEITAEYQKLMSIYTASDIFRNKYMTTYPKDKVNADIFYYVHDNGKQNVLVLVNVRNAEATFTVPAEFQGISYRNMMGGEDITLAESLTMPAYQYYILEKK